MSRFLHNNHQMNTFVVLQGIPGDGMSNTIDTAVAVSNNGSNNNLSGMFSSILPLNKLVRTVTDDVPLDQDDAGSNNIRASSILAWQSRCRQAELEARQDWLENAKMSALPVNTVTDNNNNHDTFTFDTTSRWWWTLNNQLVLLEAPQPGAKIVRVLPPGSVVYRICNQAARVDELEFIRVQINNEIGYVVMKCNGYPLLGQGSIETYTDPDVWWWRVSCPFGAYVREGLDLNTNLIAQIPYGTLVQVQRKTINSMGLSRLLIQVSSNNSGNGQTVRGWCSEFLNPLSGQRGTILQPLPLPVPTVYSVNLSAGALVRQDVELTSAQVAVLPYSTRLVVTKRVYTENPRDCCIERWKVVGYQGIGETDFTPISGYISARLNNLPPDNVPVAVYDRVDHTFDTSNAGEWHYKYMESNNADDYNNIMNGNNGNYNVTPDNSDLDKDEAIDMVDNRCLICLCEDRNATLVHGETGHIASCLMCARILKGRNDPCPVCRMPIDLVVQHFWA